MSNLGIKRKISEININSCNDGVLVINDSDTKNVEDCNLLLHTSLLFN